MKDRNEERVELRAMKCATHHYEKSGWEVKDVAGLGGEYAGCDLFLKRGSQQRKIEVKGCTKLYGIPDFYDTEIDPESKRLVADELCVVYYLPGGQRKLAIIRRDDILPENIVTKLAYRLRKFKNAKVMTKFLIEIQECPD